MSGAGRLPAGLEDMPPGPGLAAVLARIDPAACNGYELVELSAAYARMVSHYQAGLATVLDHVAHSPAGDADTPPERLDTPSRWAPIEIAAKLRWSVRKATLELHYAHQLSRRLPEVHAAWSAGAIDQPRARAFVDGLTAIEQAPARHIARQLLADGAGGSDLRTLADRLRKHVIVHDPTAATRRYAQRLAQRRLLTRRHPDGTADLLGLHLPPHRVAAITERVTAIARTARRRGDPRSIDQLKADTYTDLLTGTGIGHTPPAPITHQDQPRRGPDSHDSDARPDLTPAGDQHPASTPAQVPLPGPRRGVLELTAPLSTLIGLSQAPGLVAGYGPVIADILRQIVAEDPSLRWRYSIYDDLGGDPGRLAHHGITHARPQSFSAADAAFIRARDRTCRGPQGCHAPASACELDHTTGKADGGGHTCGNGGALCSREHHFKHESGARLHQPQPGIFHWITPLGHRYIVKPEPYDESAGPDP